MLTPKKIEFLTFDIWKNLFLFIWVLFSISQQIPYSNWIENEVKFLWNIPRGLCKAQWFHFLSLPFEWINWTSHILQFPILLLWEKFSSCSRIVPSKSMNFTITHQTIFSFRRGFMWNTFQAKSYCATRWRRH